MDDVIGNSEVPTQPTTPSKSFAVLTVRRTTLPTWIFASLRTSPKLQALDLEDLGTNKDA